MTQSKCGYLIINLGSPDSPDVPDVKRYLDQFLMDPYVIDKPWLLRALLVKGLILPKRSINSSEAYRKIWDTKGSPLILHSIDLLNKLKEQGVGPITLGMRYGNPSIPDACAELLRQAPDLEKIIVLPLYPQYAMSTITTCVKEVEKSLKKLFYTGEMLVIDPFYKHSGYIDVLADSIQKQLPKQWDHLLFSFHGLPERHLMKTDPTGKHCMKEKDCCNKKCEPAQNFCYSYQCYYVMNKVAEKLNLSKDSYSASFQSRLGRDKWIEPYTDILLEEFPMKGIKRLAVVCPAFVADCLETLEEIEMEGASEFKLAGGEAFHYIKCLNSDDSWINFSKQLLIENS